MEQNRQESRTERWRRAIKTKRLRMSRRASGLVVAWLVLMLLGTAVALAANWTVGPASFVTKQNEVVQPGSSQAFQSNATVSGNNTLPSYLRDHLRALETAGNTIMEDYPTILPNSEQHVSERRFFAWVVEGNNELISLEAMPKDSLHRMGLVVSDVYGNVQASTTSCFEQIYRSCINDLKLNQNKNYFLILSSLNGAPISATVSYRVGQPLAAAPQSLELADYTDTEAHIQWKDTDQAGHSKGYLVQLMKDSVWEDVGFTKQNDFVIKDMPHSKKIQLRVIALNADGAYDHASTSFTFQSEGSLTNGVPVALQNGEFNWRVQTNDPTYELIWSSDPYVYTQKIPEIQVVDSNGQLVATNMDANGKVVDSFLKLPAIAEKQTYRVNVNVFNSSGSAGTLVLQSKDTTPPTVPNIILAKSINNPSPSIELQWSYSSDDRGVRWYEMERNGAAYGILPFDRIIDTVVKIGETYNYRVRAVDLSGNVSEWSKPVTVKVTSGSFQLYVPKVFAGYSSLCVKSNRPEVVYPIECFALTSTGSDHEDFVVAQFDPGIDPELSNIYLSRNGSIDSGAIKTMITSGTLKQGTFYYNGHTWVSGKPPASAAYLFYPVQDSNANAKVYVHYRLTGMGWTNAPGVQMSVTQGNSYRMLMIPLLPGQVVEEAAFYNEYGIWDNFDGKNYRFTSGFWTIGKGEITNGVPQLTTWTPLQVAVQYCNVDASEKVYMHYRENLSGWTTAPGVELSKSATNANCREYVFSLRANNRSIAEAAFYLPKSNRWDNNGGKNYSFKPGRWLVQNQTIKALKAFNATSR